MNLLQNLTNPDQPGPSSSIRLEVMCVQTFCNFFFAAIVKEIVREEVVEEWEKVEEEERERWRWPDEL